MKTNRAIIFVVFVLLSLFAIVTLLQKNTSLEKALKQTAKDRAYRDSIYHVQDSLIGEYHKIIAEAEARMAIDSLHVNELENEKNRLLNESYPDYGDPMPVDSVQQREISRYLRELSRLRNEVLGVVQSDTLIKR